MDGTVIRTGEKVAWAFRGFNAQVSYFDGESAQAQPLDLLVQELAVEGDHGLQGLLGELLEPVDHGPVSGKPGR